MIKIEFTKKSEPRKTGCDFEAKKKASRLLFSLLIANMFLFMVSASQAATRYVNSAAAGANNGSSWVNAHTRLQDALAIASSGDQIWIATGTYKPSSTGDRSQSFNVPSGVSLYGSFAGTESTLTQRTSSTATTILSGDLQGNDNGNRGRNEATRLDNTYNVIRVIGASSTVTFDGLIIQSGHTESYGDTYDRGAGIHFLSSTAGNVTIHNCIIRWNTARSGGGIYDDSNHAFTITATQVFENQTERGGAAGFGSSFTIKNSAFIGNRTENSRDGYQWGGGLFISNGAGQIINCLFASNYAAESGGAIFHNGGNTDVINCTFCGNSAGVSGQTLHNYNSLNFRVSNSIIWSSSGGGSVIGNSNYNFSGTYTQVRSSLVQGGYSGSGTVNVTTSDPLFTNSASPLGADGRLGTADDGLRLGSGSPAINTGNGAYVPSGTLTDISGSTRVSGMVDMGAYETIPIITSQPQSVTLAKNDSANFIVAVTGIGSLSYQWQKDGVDIPGATSSSFSLASAQPWHIGDYRVKITDSAGTVTSEMAALSIRGVNSGIYNGLIAYYQFDGGAADKSVFGFHGTVTNAILETDRFGRGSNSYLFGSATSKVSIPSLLNLSGNSFTISFWSYRNSPDTTLAKVAFDQGTIAASHQRILVVFRPATDTFWPPSSLDMSFWGTELHTPANSSSLNAWEHWTVVYDKTNATRTIFKNGNQLATMSSASPNTSVGATIGNSNDENLSFDGKIDDFRIYNRAVTSTEVQAIYVSEATIAPATESPSFSQLSATSATLGGNVTTDGGASITERGVVYSATATNNDPLIGGSGVTKVTAVGTTGVFTATVTGLSQGTGYSFKAYAINSQGTTYTSVATFTTLSTNADLSTMTLSSGTLSPAFTSGTTAYTASVSNATASITATPTRSQASASIEARVNGGTYAAVTSGSPSASLPLNVGSNTVDVRVTAQDGTTQKTYTVTVTRMAAPTVSTPTATSINATGATLGGNVTADGGATITERGVVYAGTATNNNPLIGGTGVTKVNATGTTGVFTTPITGLSQGTGYSFKAYAINSQGTTYSSVVTFTTLSTNADLSALTLSSGTLSPVFANGTITYGAGVSGATSSLTLTPTAAQGDATIEVRVNAGSYAAVNSGSPSAALSLRVGTNTVDVRVTAQDGVTQKIYTVAVTRDNPLRNLAVAQRVGTRLVDLTYDLDVPSPVKITVEISSDGGQTYFVPAYALSGDVGLNIGAGNGKVITWNAGADWLGNFSNQMRFRIVADDLTDGFSYIPEGPFTMGRTSGDTDSDAPPVSVKVSHFKIQTTETTKAQWDDVRAWGLINGYNDLAAGGAKGENHPVHSINWYDVMKWCNARSEKEGLIPCYRISGNVMRTGTNIPAWDSSANGYRLPTEAEWEKAARGGVVGKRFPWATDTINFSNANYYANETRAAYDTSGYTVDTFHPVYQIGLEPYTSPAGSFAGNGFNIYDMSGNLWEWCWDWYDPAYYNSDAVNPVGPSSGTYRVVRGGSYISAPWGQRCSYRLGNRQPINGSNNRGFRSVRNAINNSIIINSDNFALDARIAQSITFPEFSDKLTIDSVSLAATGGASGNAVTFEVTSGPGVITNNILTFTTSGSVTITASQAGNDNYLAAPDVSRTFTVTKATAPIVLGSLAQTFNTMSRAATATTEPAGLTVNITYGGSSTAPANAGSYAVVATINDLIYQGSATGTLEIGKASQAITFAAIPDKLTTDSVSLTATGGDSGNPVTFAVTSGPGVIINNVLTFTSSGSVTVTASQAGSANYLAAPDASRTFTVTKATAAVMLGSLAQKYNTTPRTATATTEPVGLSVEFTYDDSQNPPTNAGTYAVVATINDLIYQGSATGTLEIGKDSQTITFASIPDKLTTDSVNLTGTGGGSANPVTFAVTSGPGMITNNVLTFTTSGSVTITASQAGNANYLAAPDVSRTFNVTKAMATVTLGSLAQTFINTPLAATATTEPAGLTVSFSYAGSSTPPTNAGSYEVVATINDLIYQGSATGTLEIGKASQAITFAAVSDKLTTDSVNLTATGGGSGNAVTFVATSGSGVITNNVLTFTASGSVTITASQAGNDNYLAAPDVSRTFNVTKATATVTVGSLAQTYNTMPRAATATTEPAGLNVEFTYDGSSSSPTNAGSYAVVATINDLIYQGSATGTLEIGKASQAITFVAISDKLTTDSVSLTATGGGSGNAVTFAVSSGPGVIINNVLTFTTSGSVTITASQAGSANYLAAPDVSRTFTVTKATATVMLGSLAQTYNSTPRSATATTDPAGLSVEFTYDGSANPPTNAGTYAVVGTINDLIYQGSATGTLEIGKDSQAITFGAITDKLTTDSVSLTATGGDSGNPVTFAVTSGPGVIINNVLTFTTSGSVTITASQAGSANYLAAPDLSRTFTVTKATATVMLGSLAQTYNTTPRSATATTDPAGLSVEFTYDGSANPPTNAGTYAVVGTINDLIYQGSATGTLEIGKDSQTISFGAITDKLTTDSVNLTATGGGSANPVTFAVTSGPAVITNNVLTFTTSGTVTITASQAGNANYMAAEDVSRTFNVTKAEAPITFAQLSQVANGTPRPVSVSTTPSDLTVTTLYAGSPTAPTLPGSYAVSSTIEDPIYQGTASASLTVLGLTGLDQPILSGSTTPVVINGTDYGNVTLGRVLTRVFTLSNPGSQPVTLSGNPLVEVEGDHAGDFQVSVLPEAVIPAGGSVSFELRFAPTQPGARAARVKLACAALANGPITFAVQGFGALPAPRTQTLTFAPPATLYLSQSPLQLIATASSGLPVSLQVISGPATLDQDGLLTFSSAGIVKVEARQAGNGSFAAAPSVQRTITVKPDPTGLTLVDLIKTYNGQPQEAGVVGAGDADVAVTYKVGATYREAPPVNAGQYPVKAVAGTVTKTGMLVINPAPLVVNVEDKRRLVGEDNPAITVIFEGFIGADTLASVLEKPITTGTTATKTSPVGSYPITSSGGGVKPNYRLVHRPGTLVVEGVVGSYEALLRHPTSGLPNGHLALSVPGASRTFTASLRLSQETAPISWNGILALSAQSRLATAKVSKSVSGIAYELKVELSMFGELSCEVRRAGELIAASEDGIRLLTLATGQKAAQEGNYTAILEPAKPAAAAVPVAAGWATGKVDAKGLLTLTGRLGDGTSFTAGMAADVAEKPGYRLFIQPYLPARRGSHLGGIFTLTPHPRHAGRSYVAGSDMTWVKVGHLKDINYRTDFGPVTTTLRLDPWQAPTTTKRLATRLELAADGRWEVEHSDTGSLSQGALPTLVGVNATNVVSVVTPQDNTRKWKITLTPATGAYTGSFELLDLTEKRTVNFSGVLRQTPTLADDLIGAGHYVLPALKADQNQEQKTGAVLFWRSE